MPGSKAEQLTNCAWFGVRYPIMIASSYVEDKRQCGSQGCNGDRYPFNILKYCHTLARTSSNKCASQEVQHIRGEERFDKYDLKPRQMALTIVLEVSTTNAKRNELMSLPPSQMWQCERLQSLYRKQADRSKGDSSSECQMNTTHVFSSAPDC